MSLNTTILTKTSCISLLKNCKSFNHLKQIHAQMFLIGLHQTNETLNKLIAFCTHPSHGNLTYAEKTLTHTQNPSLLTYNLIIKAFAKNRSFRKALSLFDQLRKNGLFPDNFTYPFVFKAIGCLGKVIDGVKLHGFVIKTAMDFDPYVCNSLMDMYAGLNKIDVAKKVFDEMSDRDCVSWNVLISGYVKCRRFEDAVNVYRMMKHCSDLKPEEATVVSTLSACRELKYLELGKEIHRYIVENEELKQSIVIYNALLDMYCKCGCLTIAREIFDSMPKTTKNVICWNSMVSGYVNDGQLDEARSIFNTSPVRDVILYTTMINGYVQFNRFDEALELFRVTQIEKMKPDNYLVVVLLTGCAQSGALHQGKWIHDYIIENDIKIDTVVATALVEMYAKSGCINKALEIFHTITVKDAALWTSIIYGLAMNGMTRNALALFSDMEKVASVKPDDITFIGVLTACSHGGLVNEGRKFFHSMTKVYNIEPKFEHYGCFIDLLGRAGLLEEAEEMIREIPNRVDEVIVPLYGALLSACRTYGNVEMGERVANELENIESGDSSIHTLLANIYASAGRWHDATKVRGKMKDLGVKKVPGCSSIELNGVVHEFIIGDPSHPEMEEIYSMLDRLSKPMSVSEHKEVFPKNISVINF